MQAKHLSTRASEASAVPRSVNGTLTYISPAYHFSFGNPITSTADRGTADASPVYTDRDRIVIGTMWPAVSAVGTCQTEQTQTAEQTQTDCFQSEQQQALTAHREVIHQPVMCREVLEVLNTVPDGVLVDATIGGAGHALALLEQSPSLQLVGIDRDMEALRTASQRLDRYKSRVSLHHARFDRLGDVLDRLGHIEVSAVLFDLGVSSAHFDVVERGFSYRLDGPLDMRMDTTSGKTAADVVNSYSSQALASMLRENSDERFAGRIAEAIVAQRPFSSTVALADVVKAAVPAATCRRVHPARRAFQALRIEVNDELRVLVPALNAAVERLKPSGRCAVLSYHSGEDRLVKNTFRSLAGGVQPPRPGPPIPFPSNTEPYKEPSVRLVWRGVRTPSTSEVSMNRRSSSARFRAVERLKM